MSTRFHHDRRGLRRPAWLALLLLPLALSAQAVGLAGVNASLPDSDALARATGLKPFDKIITVRACLFDPLGANGPINQLARDVVLEAKRWNLDLRVQSYPDERVAADEFKAGRCDALAVSTWRARQFNHFSGSFDALGNFSSYAQMKTALRLLHTNPASIKLLTQGDYQTIGLVPVGAAYLMVNDRQISGLDKAIGKRFAVLDWDRVQRHLTEQIGAQAVSVDLTNFGTRFNNGQADIITAPAITFQPLELYRGMGDRGGVLEQPMVMMTASITVRRSVFVRSIPDFDERLQKVREFALGYLDAGFELIERMDRTIPPRYWLSMTDSEREKLDKTLRQTRLDLIRSGYYDARMLKLLKRVRCHHQPRHYECALDDE